MSCGASRCPRCCVDALWHRVPTLYRCCVAASLRCCGFRCRWCVAALPRCRVDVVRYLTATLHSWCVAASLRCEDPFTSSCFCCVAALRRCRINPKRCFDASLLRCGASIQRVGLCFIKKRLSYLPLLRCCVAALCWAFLTLQRRCVAPLLRCLCCWLCCLVAALRGCSSAMCATTMLRCDVADCL